MSTPNSVRSTVSLAVFLDRAVLEPSCIKALLQISDVHGDLGGYHLLWPLEAVAAEVVGHVLQHVHGPCACADPALPVPPRLPAPLPLFLPRPWVLVPLNLSVLLTIASVHLHIILSMRSFISSAAVAQGTAGLEAALAFRRTPSWAGLRRNSGLTSFMSEYWTSPLEIALGEGHDRGEGDALLDHLIVDGLVAHAAGRGT